MTPDDSLAVRVYPPSYGRPLVERLFFLLLDGLYWSGRLYRRRT